MAKSRFLEVIVYLSEKAGPERHLAQRGADRTLCSDILTKRLWIDEWPENYSKSLCGECAEKRLSATEARVAGLEDALRRLVDSAEDDNPCFYDEVDIARAALEGEAEECSPS